jgi:hypothetical protein
MVMMKTPEEFFEAGQSWMFMAELNAETHGGDEGIDRSATLALLAIASALLGLCAQAISEQPPD